MDKISNSKIDVLSENDVEEIVKRFYDEMLEDPIVGFIFTEVAKIDLEHHLPIINNFWTDILFKRKTYRGNALQKHVELNRMIRLKEGHFTRWLFLFRKAVDKNHAGVNAELMKTRAEMVAKTISATISERKKSDMHLTLPKS
ncbi:MAG: group III truncated hemoglobin [Acidiferrobacterales bacterium]|nr:group III truncated hemoglobin [Acidiferrobacterales bacterium]